jgi:plasmid maintenance system antidote protein VapI
MAQGGKSNFANALRIEKAFGVKMDTLMRMQSSYDIAQTRRREKTIRVERIYGPSQDHA